MSGLHYVDANKSYCVFCEKHIPNASAYFHFKEYHDG